MKTNKTGRIKIGDLIQIISGIHKGYIGKINKIFFKKSVVFIEGLAPRIKYQKNKQGGESKRIELNLPINLSNVMLWDKNIERPSKIGYKIVEQTKYRYFKKSGNLLSEKE
jgi:large subunit ribosomal protein L24